VSAVVTFKRERNPSRYEHENHAREVKATIYSK